MTVRQIDPTRQFREDIVRELRRALERAERGELRAVMILVEAGDDYQAFRAGDSDIARRIGMLEMAKHSLLREGLR